jgi:hypothetical protein
MQAKQIAGEYYLTGVMETASGILLKEDYTFDFYYTYGVVDRIGAGKWELKGQNILLHSDDKDEQDFTLVKKIYQPEEVCNTIRIVHPNIPILSYTECLLQNAETQVILRADKNGIIEFEKKLYNHISLFHILYSDEPVHFEINTLQYNLYIFKIENTLGKIRCNSIELTCSDDALFGPHPILKDKLYTYKKS